MSLREVPADLATAFDMPDWRSKVAWPLAHAESGKLLRSQLGAFVRFLANIEDQDLRNIAVLAGHGIMVRGRAIILTAAAIAASQKADDRFVGQEPELLYLQGEWPEDKEIPERPFSAFPDSRVRYPWLRRVARIASWTPWWRTPMAMLFPEATAITHNAMLRDYAAFNGVSLGYSHDFLLLEKARKYEGTPRTDLKPISEKIRRLLLEGFSITEPVLGRAQFLLDQLISRYLASASKDLSSLRQLKRLPEAIWAGTGGGYASRAIGLEVIRRGGTVRRFDHGGSNGLIDCPESFALIELFPSTEYVAATSQAAETIIESGGPKLLAPLAETKIIGHHGDPTYKKVPIFRKLHKGSKLRVVYAPSALIGFRHPFHNLLQDTVYLNWQMDLAESLNKLPIELICKPHPEGLMEGKRHPLEDIATTKYGKFEDLIEDTDVFIFDYPPSTTFWESLCTDRRVVLIDLGIAGYSKNVRPLVNARCHTLEAEWDSDNRPFVNQDALADSILGKSKNYDPMPIRRLLVNEDQDNPLR